MRKIRIILSWVLVIGWMGIIYYLSGMTTDESNSKSKMAIIEAIEKTVDATNKVGITDKHPTVAKKEKVTDILNKPLRKVAHASVYFILAILLIHSFIVSNLKEHKILLLYFFITIFVCFLYAASDEYHQTFVRGRTGQLSDVFIDTAGAFIGTSMASLVYIGIRKKKRRKNLILK